MSKYQIWNKQKAINLGVFEADDEAGALDAMAREAGFADYKSARDAAPFTCETEIRKVVDLMEALRKSLATAGGAS